MSDQRFSEEAFQATTLVDDIPDRQQQIHRLERNIALYDRWLLDASLSQKDQQRIKSALEAACRDLANLLNHIQREHRGH